MIFTSMETDKMLDVICEITPAVGNIVNNEAIVNILKDKVKPVKGDTEETIRQKGFKKGVENLTKIVPILLKENREDIYLIISVLNEKSIEDIKRQPVTETLKQINELLKDDEVKEVFTSFTS